VRLALRDPLPVEVRHLLDQVMILQQNRAIGTDGQRMLIASLSTGAPASVVVGMVWS
jgi:hypothetical protein